MEVKSMVTKTKIVITIAKPEMDCFLLRFAKVVDDRSDVYYLTREDVVNLVELLKGKVEG